MPKGGGRRTYNRDSNGRFASSGGGKSGATKGGTLASRTSLKKTRRKTDANSSPQQQGALTRAKSKLQKAKMESRRKLGIGSPKNTLGGKIIGKKVNKIVGRQNVAAYDSARKKGASIAKAVSAMSSARQQMAERFRKSGSKAAPKTLGAKEAKPQASSKAKATKKPSTKSKGSGGSSVAAGRKAKEKWQMKQANQRFKKTSLPAGYSPKQTRKLRRVGNF